MKTCEMCDILLVDDGFICPDCNNEYRETTYELLKNNGQIESYESLSYAKTMQNCLGGELYKSIRLYDGTIESSVEVN